MIKRWTSSFLIMGLLSVGFSAHAGWEQTFSDEFDGTSLNLNKWRTSDLWGNQTLGGNGEQQCYLPNQFEFANGSLRIRAEKKVTPKAQCKSALADLPYASGMITTALCNAYESGPQCANTFSQAYGYFEMSARVPKGKGFWPGFWLLPIDGSWPPEIDIMEQLGHDPFTVYLTYHYNNSAGTHVSDGKTFKGDVDLSAGYHRFGIDWQPGLLIWYVDGVERFRHSGADVTSKPAYILANLAVGGYWPGNPDASTPFPSYLDIDYIRVYKRVANGQPDTLPPMSSTTPAPTPTPTPTPAPAPGPAANAFSISAPANLAQVSGTVVIKGVAGSNFKNLAVFDSNWKKVAADVTPAGGAFSVSLNTSQFANGQVKLTLMAFTVPAGQSGGSNQQLSLTLNVQNAVASPTWTKCADEGGRCSFSGTKVVRYGVTGAYVQKTVTGGVACTNAVFGDPKVGVGKHCDVRN